jgi:hypothetical protein
LPGPRFVVRLITGEVPMTTQPNTGWQALLEQAARDFEGDMDSFLRSAWFAYLQARPGMREYLEELQLLQQLERMREAGQIAQA